jgi:hypothetical protein
VSLLEFGLNLQPPPLPEGFEVSLIMFTPPFPSFPAPPRHTPFPHTPTRHMWDPSHPTSSLACASRGITHAPLHLRAAPQSILNGHSFIVSLRRLWLIPDVWSCQRNCKPRCGPAHRPRHANGCKRPLSGPSHFWTLSRVWQEHLKQYAEELAGLKPVAELGPHSSDHTLDPQFIL